MEIDYRQEIPEIDPLYSLFQTTGWYKHNPISPCELAQAIANSQYTISAYAGSKLVGFGRVVTDGVLHAMIYEMIVEPDHQKRGIGKRILKLLVDYCLQRNIRDIQLFCAKGKRGFYEKFGFSTRPEDAPGMQYSLKRPLRTADQTEISTGSG